MPVAINPYKNFLKESFLSAERNASLSPGSRQGKRIAWIDVAKGICIILVVLRHNQFDMFNLPFLNPLRMPLYFVLSGMFFKDYGSLKVFFSKKTNNLIIPCIFWLIAGYVLINSSYFTGGEIKSPAIISDVFLNRSIAVNNTLWFLLCLFSTNAIFYLLHKWLKGIMLAIGVLCTAIIGNLLSLYDIKLNLWIDSACTAMPFFYLGWCLNNGLPLLSGKSRVKDITLAIILIFTSIAIDYFFDEPHFNLGKNETPFNPLLVYINSISIVLGLLLICKHLQWLPIVSYFGRYSIIVLCSHLLIIMMINVIFRPVMQTDMASFMVLSPFVVIMACWLFIPLAKTYLPYFTAQKNIFEWRQKRRRTAPSPLTPDAG